ncbi:MAG: hypothetical protein PHV36_03560 [Elusimicrobiales bacterium]|nr:hypothetical protein [Elusimicrobiales bacterium]
MNIKALRNGAFFSLACGAVIALAAVSGRELGGLVLLPVAVFLPGLVFLGWRHSVVSGDFGWGKAFWTGLIPAISAALTGLVLVFLGFIAAMAQTRNRDGILAYGILATLLAFSPLAGGIGGLLRNLLLVLQGGGDELIDKEPAPAVPQSGEAAAGPLPAQKRSSAVEDGRHEQPYRLLLSLPFFAALGAASAINSIMFHRVLLGDYDGSFLFWLALFLLSLGGCLLALYALQSLRERRGGRYLLGMNTLSMALCSVLSGMLGAYYLWTPPPLNGLAERMDREIAAKRAAAQSLVSVSGISESHVPGSGEIVLKILVSAARPIKISGGGWVSNWAKYEGPRFSCEGEEQRVLPGPAQAVTLRIVYPDRDFIPPLTSDGPYMIPEITAYVSDLAAEGRHSEKVILWRHYRTGAYKAATFGRGKIRLAGDK